MRRRENRMTAVIVALAMAAALTACGSAEEEEESTESTYGFEAIPEDATIEALEAANEEEEIEEEQEEEDEEYVLPDDMYYSELTGEPISKDIEDQRPVAIMIDNDSRALPHYGLADADVVYELMNSTANNRITRLMALYKDWGEIEMVGSIRSVRPTNILLAQEWDAVICHDGGPYYVDDYFSRYNYHFSGTFSRVDNGKATEFTEYVLAGDLEDNFASSSYSTTYDDRKQDGDHFNFVDYGDELILSEVYDDAVTATNLSFPFYNTESGLKYNESTGTYDYYEFGEICEDGDTGDVVTFENVFVLNCDYSVYDDNGYMIYNCITSLDMGYYCTNGEAIAITWAKLSEGGITTYYDVDGNELTVNTGKTYITLIPNDTWDEVTLN